MVGVIVDWYIDSSRIPGLSSGSISTGISTLSQDDQEEGCPPNVSFLHASQLDGSPLHTAVAVVSGSAIVGRADADADVDVDWIKVPISPSSSHSLVFREEWGRAFLSGKAMLAVDVPKDAVIGWLGLLAMLQAQNVEEVHRPH